eukprot:scaffold69077_cov37-Prasinocladus_malaysianus.AAC.2
MCSAAVCLTILPRGGNVSAEEPVHSNRPERAVEGRRPDARGMLSVPRIKLRASPLPQDNTRQIHGKF